MYDKRTDGHSKFETIHNDDLGQVESRFLDVPIYNWAPTDTMAREIYFSRKRVYKSKGAGVLAEVLPGEIRCKDNVIRRETAVNDFALLGSVGIEEELKSSGYTVRHVSIREAEKLSATGACIVWRPRGSDSSLNDYALEVTT